MVLTGKPFMFAAGADIEEFPKLRSREEAIAGSRAGHELFGRIRALPFPTVAAINGACLGGGVEIALHCAARTISTAVRHFAAPEVFLGIIPGWGGTQLVPRLVASRRDPLHRREPAAPEQDARRAEGDRARLRRPAARARRVRRRVDRVRARAGRAPLERPEPEHGDVEKACARAARRPTTPCTARRARRTCARSDRAREQGR